LFIVTELLKQNLYEVSRVHQELGREPYFTLARIQNILRQVLTAMEFIHSLRLIHSDLKPENILIKSFTKCEVKVIDFGSSCYETDKLTSYVQSRSYRAPEVILGYHYSTKIDIWSVGCIAFELWTGRVLFVNDSVPSMLARIQGVLGPFTTDFLSRCSLASKFLSRDGVAFGERDGAENEGKIFLFT
jgi:serine/threonine protein kinase